MSTSAAPSPALKGGCQCGAIIYTSTSLPSNIVNCHCRTCRRLSGAPFLSFASFPISAITWTSGASSLKKTRYSSFAERAHCSECGSPLYMYYEAGPEELAITAGSIDEASVKGALPKVDHHVFVKESASIGSRIGCRSTRGSHRASSLMLRPLDNPAAWCLANCVSRRGLIRGRNIGSGFVVGESSDD